jgi:hypothetical protein
LMMSGTDMISFYADAHYFTLHSAADLAWKQPLSPAPLFTEGRPINNATY